MAKGPTVNAMIMIIPRLFARRLLLECMSESACNRYLLYWWTIFVMKGESRFGDRILNLKIASFAHVELWWNLS